MKNWCRVAAIKRRWRGRFAPNQALILTSSPRSGGTLLSQALSAVPGMGVLFEPLHLTRVPAAAAAQFSWRTYVPPDTPWPEGEAFLRRVFAGDVVNAWTLREMSLAQAWRAERLLFKFVRANRLLPWLCRAFSVPTPVLLVRHPCAVVASQMRFGWQNVHRPEAPPFLAPWPRFARALAACRGDEENLAAGSRNSMPPSRAWPELSGPSTREPSCMLSPRAITASTRPHSMNTNSPCQSKCCPAGRPSRPTASSRPFNSSIS